MFVIEDKKLIGMADTMTDNWSGQLLLIYIGKYPVNKWCTVVDAEDNILGTGRIMTTGTVGEYHTGTLDIAMHKAIRPSCDMGIHFVPDAQQ